jgi:hypothetical protein
MDPASSSSSLLETGSSPSVSAGLSGAVKYTAITTEYQRIRQMM